METFTVRVKLLTDGGETLKVLPGVTIVCESFTSVIHFNALVTVKVMDELMVTDRHAYARVCHIELDMVR